ncbi:hypothetical protein BDN72DRAFT_126589 [Pluteus cervinus]|uniref:Uncharacterized protein n=1 Tax=Pluteus cervinus TaxID=181527 RepID=A0ACD3AMY1_9AGAR|nr:hypothetical protein BDN72DRAFT_126589 [Pluteus cervinus]
MAHTAPDLPLELVQEIFISSAESSSRQAALLATVSRETYELIKPILLRTFVYWDQNTFQWPGPLTADWFKSNGKYARNLLVGGSYLDELIPLLGSCPNLVNIAIWFGSDWSSPMLLEQISKLSPQRLSVNLIGLMSLERFTEKFAQLPVFTNLTHLELASVCNAWEEVEGIQYLPKLTHLSMPEYADQAIITLIRNALEYCAVLKVLVMFGQAGIGEVVVQVQTAGRVKEIGDPRIVSLHCNYLEEWLLSASGGKGMWALAEEIVASRLLVTSSV